MSFVRPVRAKALIDLRYVLELLPLQGAIKLEDVNTRGVAPGWELLPLEFLQYRLRSAELQASLALLSFARYFRANETTWARDPGRCPGLSAYCPFGALSSYLYLARSSIFRTCHKSSSRCALAVV